MSYVDFAALKAALGIEKVAETLGLTLKQEGSQFRTACPACKSGGDRAIVLTPAKALFYCFSAKKGGDCIGLAAHVMGVGNNDAANFLVDQLGPAEGTVPDRVTSTVSKECATAPQKPEGRKQPASKTKGFDREKFGKSLEYNGEVEGLSKANAELFRIGTKRQKLYFPICPPDVDPVCWAELKDGKLRLPDEWLPTNVVRLKRPA